MPEMAFVMGRGLNWPLVELVETLRHELRLQGVPSSVHEGSFPEYRPDRVYAVVDPAEYLALEGERVMPAPAILRRTIFICAERPAALADEKRLELLRRAGAVFDLDQRAVLAMRRAGIPARQLKPGYSTLRDRFDPDADAERPIDVMFLGRHTPRRAKVLARCAPVLARHNCLLQIADGTYANPHGSSSYLAESKWALLAQTKILLDIHGEADDDRFAWLRALDAMHAGAVIVTELASGLAPFDAGRHLLIGRPDALPWVLEAALCDPARLRTVREAAHERLRAWLPFALSVSVLRAAAVELVGEPVAEGTSLGHAGPPPEEPAERWRRPRRRGVEPIRHELARASLELAEVRRRLAQVGAADGGRGSAGIDHESPAWAARRLPRVTALLLAEGAPGRLAATLDAFAASWLRDVEIIVVAGEVSGPLAVEARAWMRRHPRVPGRLLATPVAAGRGASLEAGLGHARAPYLLLLHPGDELFPRGLDVLVGTLDAMPDAAFAYPIVAIEGSGAPGELASYLGWDPRRLRLGNPVSGPALVRTAVVTELGGFARDPVLEGHEEYDLWCRVGESGRRGQLVPQILGRRAASVAALANLREELDDAVALTLADRAPTVLAGALGNG